MLEVEFTSSERQATENRNAAVNIPNGCFHNRLGAVTSGKEKTYQCTGAYCSETCNIHVYQRQIGNSNPLTNRQDDSSVLQVEMGETHSQKLLQVAKEIWDYLLPN